MCGAFFMRGGVRGAMRGGCGLVPAVSSRNRGRKIHAVGSMSEACRRQHGGKQGDLRREKSNVTGMYRTRGICPLRACLERVRGGIVREDKDSPKGYLYGIPPLAFPRRGNGKGANVD